MDYFRLFNLSIWRMMLPTAKWTSNFVRSCAVVWSKFDKHWWAVRGVNAYNVMSSRTWLTWISFFLTLNPIMICLPSEQVLHLWLETLCSCVEVVEKWYHPWSFIRSPGWVQIKCELRWVCLGMIFLIFPYLLKAVQPGNCYGEARQLGVILCCETDFDTKESLAVSGV